MSEIRKVVAVSVAALLVAAVGGGAVMGGEASPAGATTTPEGNATEDGPGTTVATALEAQGEAVGVPIEAPNTAFDRSFYGRVSAVASAYNDARPDLGPAGGFATGNVVNLHVTTADGEEAVVSFRLTEDNRITDLRAGARTDAKLRMDVERGTFDRIAAAPSPGPALVRALEAGEIRISGRGPFSSVVWSVLNRLRDLRSAV